MCVQCCWFKHIGNNAGVVGFQGGENIAQQQQFSRFLITRRDRQQQAGRRFRAQAQFHERHGKFCGACCIHQITVQQYGSADTNGQTLHLCYHRLGKDRDHAKKTKHRCVKIGGGVVQKIAQIVARRKTAFMAFEQHHFHATAVRGIAKRVSQRGVHGVGK